MPTVRCILITGKRTHGIVTQAHVGIGTVFCFYLVRFDWTEKVKKVRCKNSIGNDIKIFKNRTWTGTQTVTAGASLEFVRELTRG